MRLLHTIAFLFLLVIAAAQSQLQAQSAARGDVILDALQIDDLLGILQDEAVESGAELAQAMLPGRSVRGWEETIARLNAPSRVGPILRGRFNDVLDPDAADGILAFYGTPEGQRIVQLELSARVALRNPEIEDAVLVRHAEMVRSGDQRVDQMDAFIAVNDLIDSNVVGALNANAAFLKGLREAVPDAGAVPDSDGAILTEVWRQEPEIREATRDWVNAFLSLAYQPLDDATLDRYTAFSASPAGQAFNAALFAAFDAAFVATSYETGVALGRLMASEDL